MNTNLLREDEQYAYDGGHGWSTSSVKLLTERLCEARAEKYEFAAQQLEQLAKQWRLVGAVASELEAKVAELRRLANG